MAMIARTWRGATSAADADAYREYLHETGLADFRRTEGNRGALALRSIEGNRAEFVILSLWDSEDAIRRFAGEDISKAVFYPEDERFLIERDNDVSHYEVLFGSALVSAA
jgi:heme-degrading monooxygenase HmoA